MENIEKEFWKKKKLKDLNDAEWEALCDHCGKCCVQKFQQGSKTVFTNIICDHLCLKDISCSIYHRRLLTGYCVKVDLNVVREMPFLLPGTCAYKLLDQGKELPAWHPLMTGDPGSVVASGNSLAAVSVITEMSAMIDPARIETIEII